MVFIQCLVLSTTEVSRSSGMFVPPDDMTVFNEDISFILSLG